MVNFFFAQNLRQKKIEFIHTQFMPAYIICQRILVTQSCQQSCSQKPRCKVFFLFLSHQKGGFFCPEKMIISAIAIHIIHLRAKRNPWFNGQLKTPFFQFIGHPYYYAYCIVTGVSYVIHTWILGYKYFAGLEF